MVSKRTSLLSLVDFAGVVSTYYRKLVACSDGDLNKSTILSTYSVESVEEEPSEIIF